MQLRHCVRYLGAAAAVAALPALAQPVPPDPASTFTFTIENDLFGGTDKYYTSGFQFTWRSPSYDPPPWLAWLGDASVPFFPSGGAQRWGLAFGQNIFTPEDTDTRFPDPDDRPYAGWLYGAVSFTSYTRQSYGAFELQLGVVGPSALGEQVQNNVHDFLNIDRANGWDTQLKDEPGINAILVRQWRINWPLDGADPDGLAIGVVPSLIGSLGNVQTYASAGGLIRIGSNLEADFGPPRLRPSIAGSTFVQPGDRWGWYAFAGVDGRLVLHDIFLDGNTWRESRSVEKEDLVADALLGLAVITPWGRLSYTHTFRTREFDTQESNAEFGSISLSVRF